MSVDCSSFESSAILINESYINYTGNDNNNNTFLYEVWLEDEASGLFSNRFWRLQSFWFGFIIICIASPLISYIYVYLFFKKYNRKQKELKLTELNIELTIRNDIYNIIKPHFDYDDDNIIDIILDYANIILHIDSESNFDKYLIAKSRKQDINKSYLKNIFYFLWMVLAAFIIPYIFLYHTFVHMDYASKSYLETQCHVINDTQYHSAAFIEIDMANICDPDTLNIDEYKFLADYDNDGYGGGHDNINNTQCYFDKNTFKIDRVSDEFLDNWSIDYFLVLFFSFLYCFFPLIIFCCALACDLFNGYEIKFIERDKAEPEETQDQDDMQLLVNSNIIDNNDNNDERDGNMDTSMHRYCVIEVDDDGDDSFSTHSIR